MAKKSMIAKNKQRQVIVERYAAKRLELKKALVDPNGTEESREAARVGLQKLPRNASPVRVRSRDVIDGRPRGVLSKFGVSRVALPRHGTPWRAARHHQVELVTADSQRARILRGSRPLLRSLTTRRAELPREDPQKTAKLR